MDTLNKKESFWKREAYGAPLWMLAILIGIIYVVTFTGKMQDDDMLSIIAIMFSLGIVFNAIGDRIPIWKDYLGGGTMLAFIGAAAFEYFEILPAKYSEAITYFYDDYGFQTVFISLLIVAAVLGVNRKQLIKAFGGYIPAILGGLVLAGIFGIGAAAVCGIDVKAAISLYVLPIMGGGNGSGAVPLSEMWESITGESKDAYYSQAIAILTLANNFAILAAVALNALGEKFPQLTGNGELLKNPEKYAMESDKEEKPKVGLYEAAGGLLLCCAMYAIARLLSKTIPPFGNNITFHMYAYLIVLTGLLNVAGVIPAKLREGVKQCSNFLTKPLMCFCMVGIGIAFTDLGELAAALTWQTVVISIAVVAGAAIGAGFVGTFFGFNFVESGITAGLCMANRGGSGDLQVLGAAKRMNLMSYAQISSRIGGAIILIIGSVLFSIMA
ncbi:MAG: 2-hydroxycarboxylate transporter family protein [Firmicutes bacterium]|mgnify:CR=1 FL=1|nr:2-hydroxycarboxylate transporter family protein [Bacillota bacterium]